ncbi:hypothetical protein [Plantactinospora sonchi]|uniref:Uncharacterized protein n=1 Tax=Plantactinospora sonchi TaxID=1544735 RepID=A0ABU7S450_9ACTN
MRRAVRTGIVAAFIGTAVWAAGHYDGGGSGRDFPEWPGTISVAGDGNGGGFGWDTPTPGGTASGAGDDNGGGFGWDLPAPTR